MNISLTINDNDLLSNVDWNSVAANCETAMAYRYYTLVDGNFGMTGTSRPNYWPALSAEYAKEFHGGNRIPKLQLTGDLQESIQVQESTGDGAEVYTNNPYALDHQYGVPERNLPARPFFPLIGDSLTPYSQAECIQACANEFERQLN